jgi:hypothetical protein
MLLQFACIKAECRLTVNCIVPKLPFCWFRHRFDLESVLCGAGAVLVSTGGVSAGIGPLGWTWRGRGHRDRECCRRRLCVSWLQQEPLHTGDRLDATGALSGDPTTNPSPLATAMTTQASRRHDRAGSHEARRGRNADPSEQTTHPHRCRGGWRFADQDAFTSVSLDG